MSKPREFWIQEPDEYPGDDYVYAFRKEQDDGHTYVHVREVPESFIVAMQEAERRGFMRAVEMLRSEAAGEEFFADNSQFQWADWLEERIP